MTAANRTFVKLPSEQNEQGRGRPTDWGERCSLSAGGAQLAEVSWGLCLQGIQEDRGQTDPEGARPGETLPGWLVMQLVAVLREQSHREGCQTWPDPAVHSSLLFLVRKIGD